MHFDVVTKTPQFAKTSLGESEAKELEESFYQSLLRLKKPSVYGVLIHRADDILVPGGELLIDRLLELKSKGLVTKIGVSVYSGEQIDKVLDRFPIDLIQLPINVLDQRLIQSGHLQKLKNTGIEVHARSAFLQGLLLMEPQHIPEYFQCIRSNLESYHHSITSKGLTPVQAALGFVSNIPEIDHIICGVNNQQQLREICAAAKVELSCADYADYAIADESIVNPALWQVGKGKK
jgi:aryl-alcohol dehydrogenase-like predicted oxidoreductase